MAATLIPGAAIMGGGQFGEPVGLRGRPETPAGWGGVQRLGIYTAAASRGGGPTGGETESRVLLAGGRFTRHRCRLGVKGFRRL